MVLDGVDEAREIVPDRRDRVRRSARSSPTSASARGWRSSRSGPPQDDEYERHELVDGPARPAQALEADLRELVATVQDPHLRRLLADLLGEGSAVWARFRDAPAAKHYHQAYRHGLLEHSLTVAQSVSAISATFPGSTATSPSPARCCMTSASSTPTRCPATRSR